MGICLSAMLLPFLNSLLIFQAFSQQPIAHFASGALCPHPVEQEGLRNGSTTQIEEVTNRLLINGTNLPQDSTELAPGLLFRNRPGCQNIAGHAFSLKEAAIAPGSALQIRALDNHRTVNPQCPGDRQRRSLPEVVAENQGFQTLFATNGNFYDGSGPSTFLWTRSTTRESTILGHFRPGNQFDLFVADSTGGHIISVRTHPCPESRRSSPEACIALGHPAEIPSQTRGLFTGILSEERFLTALRSTFPTMTLAMQVNTPLSDSRGAMSHLNCDNLPAPDWRCTPETTTVLCLKQDGSYSILLAHSPVNALSLAQAITRNGSCQTQCINSYRLDGGLSTQAGSLNADNSSFQLMYARPRLRARNLPQSCPLIRTVDHFLAIGIER